MGVRQALGIEDLVEEASQSWARWTGSEPALGRFACVADVSGWRLDATTEQTREVLLALGRLTLVGESRTQASVVLVHLLVPGCEAVVRRRLAYSRVCGVGSVELSAVAAGYLWEEVAGFPWGDPPRGSIPLSISRGVARAIDREYGWGQRGEGSWRNRSYYENVSCEGEALPVERIRELSHTDQVLQASGVYWWALSEALMTTSEMELLVQLAVAASEGRVRAGSSGGLTSKQACRVVAERIGAPSSQVRRRAERALGVLRAAA